MILKSKRPTTFIDIATTVEEQPKFGWGQAGMKQLGAELIFMLNFGLCLKECPLVS